MKAGITGYGFYVPRYRIKTEDIAQIWGKNAGDISSSLHIYEKAIAGVDEDSVTMAYEASLLALSTMSIQKKDIGMILFGSETPPYAVNPASTILGEYLGVGPSYLASDTQFACKAATGGLIMALNSVESGFMRHGLVCGSDKANGKPHDALEYTAASGSVALVVGSEKVLLEIVAMTSYSSDTPDFWRREGMRYPTHGGRFTGKPSYFKHITGAAEDLFSKTGMKPADFQHAVFHMPNGRFPQEVAKSLGFTPEHIAHSLVVPFLGNSYTASALMGLVSVLEHAKEGDYIFFASYGSGAGSDGFIFKVTKEIKKQKKEFKKKIDQKEYIDYTTYLKFMENM